MGIRGLIRDALTLYVCLVIFMNMATGNLKVDTNFILASIFLFLLTIWFLLEKLNIIPRIS